MLKNKKLATVVTAVVLALGVSGAAYSYTAPSKYVNFDINPSVELVTNMYDKVIDVKPLNEDGVKLVETLDLENKDIKEAMDILTKAAVDGGYFKEGLENEVLVTVASNDEEASKEEEQELGEVVKEELKEDNLAETPVTTQNINLTRKAEAEKLGISPGKYHLIEKLEAVKPGINFEEYAQKPVKDIMKEIKEIIKEYKKTEKEAGKIEKEENKKEKEIKKGNYDEVDDDLDEDDDDRNEKKEKVNKIKSNNGNQRKDNNGKGKGNKNN